MPLLGLRLVSEDVHGESFPDAATLEIRLKKVMDSTAYNPSKRGLVV